MKAGCCFPHVAGVSEIGGEERCFPQERSPPPVCLHRSFVQLLGFAMAIIEASLGNRYCILGAQERAAGQPRWTSVSFTCVHTNVRVHKRACTQTCTHTPAARRPQGSLSVRVAGSEPPAVGLPRCWEGAGREISETLLHFHPEKARPSIYSAYWALLPPAGRYFRANEGAVIS